MPTDYSVYRSLQTTEGYYYEESVKTLLGGDSPYTVGVFFYLKGALKNYCPVYQINEKGKVNFSIDINCIYKENIRENSLIITTKNHKLEVKLQDNQFTKRWNALYITHENGSYKIFLNYSQLKGVKSGDLTSPVETQLDNTLKLRVGFHSSLYVRYVKIWSSALVKNNVLAAFFVDKEDNCEYIDFSVKKTNNMGVFKKSKKFYKTTLKLSGGNASINDNLRVRQALSGGSFSFLVQVKLSDLINPFHLFSYKYKENSIIDIVLGNSKLSCKLNNIEKDLILGHNITFEDITKLLFTYDSEKKILYLYSDCFEKEFDMTGMSSILLDDNINGVISVSDESNSNNCLDFIVLYDWVLSTKQIAELFCDVSILPEQKVAYYDFQRRLAIERKTFVPFKLTKASICKTEELFTEEAGIVSISSGVSANRNTRVHIEPKVFNMNSKVFTIATMVYLPEMSEKIHTIVSCDIFSLELEIVSDVERKFNFKGYKLSFKFNRSYCVLRPLGRIASNYDDMDIYVLMDQIKAGKPVYLGASLEFVGDGLNIFLFMNEICSTGYILYNKIIDKFNFFIGNNSDGSKPFGGSILSMAVYRKKIENSGSSLKNFLDEYACPVFDNTLASYIDFQNGTIQEYVKDSKLVIEKPFDEKVMQGVEISEKLEVPIYHGMDFTDIQIRIAMLYYSFYCSIVKEVFHFDFSDIHDSHMQIATGVMIKEFISLADMDVDFKLLNKNVKEEEIIDFILLLIPRIPIINFTIRIDFPFLYSYYMQMEAEQAKKSKSFNINETIIKEIVDTDCDIGFKMAVQFNHKEITQKPTTECAMNIHYQDKEKMSMPEWNSEGNDRSKAAYIRKNFSNGKVFLWVTIKLKNKNDILNQEKISVLGISQNDNLLGVLNGELVHKGDGLYEGKVEFEGTRIRNAKLGKFLNDINWFSSIGYLCRSCHDIYVIAQNPLSPWSIEDGRVSDFPTVEVLEICDKILSAETDARNNSENSTRIFAKAASKWFSDKCDWEEEAKYSFEEQGKVLYNRSAILKDKKEKDKVQGNALDISLFIADCARLEGYEKIIVAKLSTNKPIVRGIYSIKSNEICKLPKISDNDMVPLYCKKEYLPEWKNKKYDDKDNPYQPLSFHYCVLIYDNGKEYVVDGALKGFEGKDKIFSNVPNSKFVFSTSKTSYKNEVFQVGTLCEKSLILYWNVSDKISKKKENPKDFSKSYHIMLGSMYDNEPAFDTAYLALYENQLNKQYPCLYIRFPFIRDTVAWVVRSQKDKKTNDEILTALKKSVFIVEGDWQAWKDYNENLSKLADELISLLCKVLEKSSNQEKPPDVDRIEAYALSLTEVLYNVRNNHFLGNRSWDLYMDASFQPEKWVYRKDGENKSAMDLKKISVGLNFPDNGFVIFGANDIKIIKFVKCSALESNHDFKASGIKLMVYKEVALNGQNPPILYSGANTDNYWSATGQNSVSIPGVPVYYYDNNFYDNDNKEL